MTSAEFQADQLPCSVLVDIAFPSERLALIALRVLSVDEELSPLVTRSLTLASGPNLGAEEPLQVSPPVYAPPSSTQPAQERTMHVTYRATTNRMLRVAVNGFFESLGVVLSTMRELDIGVSSNDWIGDDFLPANGLGAEGVTDGAALKREVDDLARVQGLTETGAL